jgi:hypothetical protein
MILAACLLMGIAAYAQGALYLTHEDGIRVAVRVRGSKVVTANVVVRLYCLRSDGSRHLNRANLGYASPQYPLQIRGDGLFGYRTPEGAQEVGVSEQEELVGHVARRTVTGAFEYTSRLSTKSRQERCQTGGFLARERRIKFRARLRQVRH